MINEETRLKILALRSQAEDETVKYIDGLANHRAALLYKVLYLRNHRISTVDYAIEQGFKKEAG